MYAAPSITSTAAAPPGTVRVTLFANQTVIGRSSSDEGTTSGRRPARSESSATRAARFAERTEASVVPASTSVPRRTRARMR